MARNAHYQHSLVPQLGPLFDKKNLAKVIYALVTSKLDCCHALYEGLAFKKSQKLQLVQNAAAYLLAGKNRFQ